MTFQAMGLHEHAEAKACAAKERAALQISQVLANFKASAEFTGLRATARGKKVGLNWTLDRLHVAEFEWNMHEQMLKLMAVLP